MSKNWSDLKKKLNLVSNMTNVLIYFKKVVCKLLFSQKTIAKMCCSLATADLLLASLTLNYDIIYLFST